MSKAFFGDKLHKDYWYDEELGGICFLGDFGGVFIVFLITEHCLIEHFGSQIGRYDYLEVFLANQDEIYELAMSLMHESEVKPSLEPPQYLIKSIDAKRWKESASEAKEW